MAKEIPAAKAREIAAQQIPAALWDKIFTGISEAANKGQRKVFIDLTEYSGSVCSDGSLFAIRPLLRGVFDKMASLGYSFEGKPIIDTVHPSIAAWIEIEW